MALGATLTPFFGSASIYDASGNFYSGMATPGFYSSLGKSRISFDLDKFRKQFTDRYPVSILPNLCCSIAYTVHDRIPTHKRCLLRYLLDSLSRLLSVLGCSMAVCFGKPSGSRSHGGK